MRDTLNGDGQAHDGSDDSDSVRHAHVTEMAGLLQHDPEAFMDCGFRLGDVAGEVRVWHGRADRNVPATHAEYLAVQLPDATLRWFEDAAGHVSMDLLHMVIDDLQVG